jgi:23S rRNA G2069 N7-methylase RlmK/C1962 C5-methylase RlmI
LDPPSTSVGGKKKKRWSAKNDYDELVLLASQLVKKGGYLWTTTNSNQISPVKFSRMCKKGLNEAGLPDAKLERIGTMPLDFPSIGSQQVKNLVWKL